MSSKYFETFQFMYILTSKYFETFQFMYILTKYFHLAAVCKMPQERGRCSNYTVRWTYSADDGQCTQFWYGGCDGNDNNFATENECKAKCVQGQGGKEGRCLHEVGGGGNENNARREGRCLTGVVVWMGLGGQLRNQEILGKV